MPRSGKTQDALNNLAHRCYQAWAKGDGSKTEFALPKTVLRLDDLHVIVAGLDLRPADATGAYDFAVRGLTPGYAGDANTVKFTVAPANGANIKFIQDAS